MTLAMGVDAIGLDQRVQSIARFVAKLQSSNLPLIASRRVAGEWRKNFLSEGESVGGWAALKESTVGWREDSGYPGKHPILYRDGDLFRVAIEGFQRRRSGSGYGRVIKQYMWGEGGSGHGGRTSASLRIKGGIAVLGVSGYKTLNQDDKGGKYPHVARPFWFVNPAVEKAAWRGVSDFVGKESKRA